MPFQIAGRHKVQVFDDQEGNINGIFSNIKVVFFSSEENVRKTEHQNEVEEEDETRWEN